MNPLLPRVLIIEDDADIRDALTQILEEEGYAVDTANHGLDALDRLRQGPVPSLILLDLMMPVMNGWQFREEQQRDPRFSGIPVVIISADAAARREAGEIGVEGFLQKPIELPQLLSLVARYCRTPAQGSAR